jgi:hypothetical protein
MSLDQNGSTSGPTPWQVYDDDNPVNGKEWTLLPGSSSTFKCSCGLCL